MVGGGVISCIQSPVCESFMTLSSVGEILRKRTLCPRVHTHHCTCTSPGSYKHTRIHDINLHRRYHHVHSYVRSRHRRPAAPRPRCEIKLTTYIYKDTKISLLKCDWFWSFPPKIPHYFVRRLPNPLLSPPSSVPSCS